MSVPNKAQRFWASRAGKERAAKFLQQIKEEREQEEGLLAAQLEGKNEFDRLKILARELLREYFDASQCSCNGGPYPGGMGNLLIDSVREIVGDRSGLLDREAYESKKRKWKWCGDVVEPQPRLRSRT